MPKKQNRERNNRYIGVRMPDSLHKRLQAAAEADKRKTSDMVRVIVEEKLSEEGK